MLLKKRVTLWFTAVGRVSEALRFCEILIDFQAKVVPTLVTRICTSYKPSWFSNSQREGCFMWVCFIFLLFHAFVQACSFWLFIHFLSPFVSIILVGYLFVDSVIVFHILRIGSLVYYVLGLYLDLSGRKFCSTENCTRNSWITCTPIGRATDGVAAYHPEPWSQLVIREMTKY